MSGSDEKIRRCIIGMLVVLLMAGQQFGVGDPLTTNGAHSEKDGVIGNLSVSEFMFIMAVSISALLLFVYVQDQQTIMKIRKIR